MKRLNEIDGSRIRATNNPEAIARRFLETAGAPEAEIDRAREMLAGGEQGWENGAHVAQDLALHSANTWAEMAHAIGHDARGARFRWLADAIIAGCQARAEHSLPGRLTQTAATLGFKLARHCAESDLARAIGGRVAAAEMEGTQIDVITADGDGVQVLTSGADSPRTATRKLSEEARDRLDAYAVLHIKEDGTFGVGVNDMREDPSTPRGESAAAKATRA